MKTLLNLVYGVLIGLLTGGVIWLAASRPRGRIGNLIAFPSVKDADCLGQRGGGDPGCVYARGRQPGE